MSFATPALLVLLLLLPLAALAYLWAQRRRSRYAVRFTNLDLLANVVGETPGWRRHIPAALYLLSLGALLVAIARPHVTEQVPRDGTVVLVSDVSGSMNATDIEPTRLGAAQKAAKTLVGQLPGGFRVAVVSFSNTVTVRVPPTTDRKPVTQAIDNLQPQGGTAMGEAILSALSLIEQANQTAGASPSAASPTPTPIPTPAGSSDPAHHPAVIVLMSDGASNTGADPVEAAGQARAMNIPVFTIALGTPGGVAEVRDNLGRLRHVAVPPDPETLQQVAETTGAKSFTAPTAEQLRSIYRDLGNSIGHDSRQRDVTIAFVVGGLVAAVAGGALSLYWFNRFP